MEEFILDTTALILAIIGSLNWVFYGLFGIDIIASVFGGPHGVVTRIVYAIIGLAGAWCITLLFREKENVPFNDKNYETSHKYTPSK